MRLAKKTNMACRGKSFPLFLGLMLHDKDPAKAKRVMQAMFQMNKIDHKGFAAGVRSRLVRRKLREARISL